MLDWYNWILLMFAYCWHLVNGPNEGGTARSVKGSVCQGWVIDWPPAALQKGPNGGVVSTPLPVKLLSLAFPSRHLDSTKQFKCQREEPQPTPRQCLWIIAKMGIPSDKYQKDFGERLNFSKFLVSEFRRVVRSRLGTRHFLTSPDDSPSSGPKIC